METAHNASTFRSAALFGLLLGLGYLGNYLPVSLFFGSDYIFGSIAGLVIISLYGWRLGFLASIIISSYTYFLWRQPYAAIVFSSEALAVGLFLHFRKKNLLIVDGLFWLILGMPLSWVLHSIMTQGNVTATLLIVFKQTVNGVANALFASLAVNLLPFERVLGRTDARKPISLHESAFNLLVALVLLPCFLIMIQNARQEKVRLESDAFDDLHELSSDLGTHLQSWYQNRLNMIGQIAALSGDKERTPYNQLQHDIELLIKSVPGIRTLYVADAGGTAIAFHPLVNDRGEPTIGMNFSDRHYFEEAERTKRPVLSTVFMGRGSASSPIVTLSVPVLDQGRFAGLVTGTLDLAKLQELLQPYGKNRGVNITLVDSSSRVLASTVSGREIMQPFDRENGAVLQQIGNSTYYRIPAGEMSTVMRWRRSYCVEEKQVSSDIPWTIIAEAPVAPLQEQLYSIYLQYFSTMAGLVMVALLLAHVLHRYPNRPLKQLAEVTTNLPSRLMENREIEWPKSSAAEIQYLIANFKTMADALGKNFQELGERSAELAKANEELKTEGEVRTRAVEALIETTNWLQEIVHASPLAIIALNRDGTVKAWNPAAEEVFGWTESEVLGLPLPTIPEDQRQAFRQRLHHMMQGQHLEAHELRRMRKDGSPVDVSAWTAPLRDAREEVVGSIALLADMSEMKRSQEALRESETKYKRLFQEFRAVLDSIPDDIALLSPELEVVWANSSLVGRLGVGPEALTARKCHVLWDCREEPCEGCPAIKTFRTGEPSGAFLSGPDGRTRESRSVPIKDESGTVVNVIEVVRDITEQRKIERQLQQAQKMEAIGTLAGGIAHDFNNILGIISGHVQLVQMDHGKADSIDDDLKQVLKACRRAKDLVQQILTFSRHTEQERKPLQVGPFVKESLKLLRASLPATIEIREAVECDGVAVVDPTQVHQIVMNLCTNAHHAMRAKGGVLGVSLKSVELDASAIEMYPGMLAGSYLQLTVTDTGHGMSPATLERIFDPFFTTKGPGEGTGLGLAVVHGIVKSLGGAIEAHSREGQGSAFDIFLPRAEAVASEAEDSPDQGIPTGSERILFVDDEAALVSVGSQGLQRFGYRVVSRTSSEEALELFRSDPGQFDLAVTDFTMPHMTGLDLAAALFAIRPGIPVILCTGYSEAVIEERAREIGIRKLLMKPVAIGKLAKVIRQVLDNGNGKG